MKNGIISILTILLAGLSYAQDCTCENTFKWLKQTFENNDAGFQYVIGQKGQAAYKQHTETYIEKVRAIEDKGKCAETLLNWLFFFRKGHIWFGLNTENQQIDNKTPREKIKDQFKNWETYAFQEEELHAYFSKLTKPDFEGIWTTSSYTIGVRKVDREFIGLLLKQTVFSGPDLR